MLSVVLAPAFSMLYSRCVLPSLALTCEDQNGSIIVKHTLWARPCVYNLLSPHGCFLLRGPWSAGVKRTVN